MAANAMQETEGAEGGGGGKVGEATFEADLESGLASHD